MSAPIETLDCRQNESSSNQYIAASSTKAETDFFDDFTADPTAYNDTLWDLETYGPGNVTWENGTIVGLHAWDHGYRTIVTTRTFTLNSTLEFRAKFSDWDTLPAIGWTDAVPGSVHGLWNYHPTIGPNGAWVEFNWPEARKFTLYTQQDTTLSWKSVTIDDYTDYHTYRISWKRNNVSLVVDGMLVANLTSNIPTDPLPVKALVTAWAGEGQGQWLHIDYLNVTAEVETHTTTTIDTTTTTTTTATTTSTTTDEEVGFLQAILDYLAQNPIVTAALITGIFTLAAARVGKYVTLKREKVPPDGMTRKQAG